MNYPGFGGSAGPGRLSAVAPAALGAYDVLQQAAGERPVFLQGASFGTAPALHVAARRPVAGLVLHKPPPLKQMILGSYGWWNLWLLAGPVAGRVPDDLDSLSNASHAKSPAVFILHGSDQIIAPRYQRRVAEAYAGPKRVIEMPGARHDDPLTSEASRQWAEARQWLWETGIATKNRDEIVPTTRRASPPATRETLRLMRNRSSQKHSA
jgi:pimeloyl-ACP methyl ester carboxylesterase